MYRFISPKRHFKTPIKLLCLLVFITVSLTSYLYGLIEIDSEKVIFKIASSQQSTGNNPLVRSKQKFYNNNNLLVARQKQSSSSSTLQKDNSDSDNKPNNDYVFVNIYNKINLDNNANNKNNNNDRQADEAFRLFKMATAKNLSTLFELADKMRDKIVNPLSGEEINKLIKIKSNYQNLVIERNRLRKHKQEEENKEEAAADKDYTASDADEIVGNRLSIPDSIHRDLVVKFLQLEKYRLESKVKGNHVMTVKKVVERKVSENEIEYG